MFFSLLALISVQAKAADDSIYKSTPGPMERLLLRGFGGIDEPTWFTIFGYLADDAVSLAKFSMASKACQRQVFVSLKSALTVAAIAREAMVRINLPYITSVSFQRDIIFDMMSPPVPVLYFNRVMPKKLLDLWWTDNNEDVRGGEGDGGNDVETNQEESNDGTNAGLIQTQYDRLEGLGCYQVLLRARTLREELVIADIYQCIARHVPQSAVLIEKMLEIAAAFPRSKSLYDRHFAEEELQTPHFVHDSFYEADCEGGIVHCTAKLIMHERTQIWNHIVKDEYKISL